MTVVFLLLCFAACHSNQLRVCHDNIITAVGWLTMISFMSQCNLWSHRTRRIVDGIMFAHQQQRYTR